MLFKDATVGYNPAAPPIDVSKVDSVRFRIPSGNSQLAFSFCFSIDVYTK